MFRLMVILCRNIGAKALLAAKHHVVVAPGQIAMASGGSVFSYFLSRIFCYKIQLGKTGNFDLMVLRPEPPILSWRCSLSIAKLLL